MTQLYCIASKVLNVKIRKCFVQKFTEEAREGNVPKVF